MAEDLWLRGRVGADTVPHGRRVPIRQRNGLHGGGLPLRTMHSDGLRNREQAEHYRAELAPYKR